MGLVTLDDLVIGRPRVRIAVVDGGNRSALTCPGQDGKTRRFVDRALSALPAWVEADVIDLSVKGDGVIVQPCKGCVGTAGGLHCHFPCDCYGPGSASESLPDLMHDHDVYARLRAADGFAVFTPVNWSAATTQVKAMFDRLVCCNLTLTVEQAWMIFGDRRKYPDLTRPAAKSGKHDGLLRNHLAGRVAAFFVHGDAGANDYAGAQPRPPATLPKTLPLAGAGRLQATTPRRAIEPVVEMCRYSGIDVPEDLVVAMDLNRGLDYASANDARMDQAFREAESLLRRLAAAISERRGGR